MSKEKTGADSGEALPWRRLKVQIVILAALILFAFVYFVLPSWMVKSRSVALAEPYAVPAELQYVPPARLAAEENGFEILRKTAAMVPEKPMTTSFDLGWATAVDRDWVSQIEVDQFVEHLKPAWELMDKAVEKTQWQRPPIDWTKEHGVAAELHRPLPTMSLAVLVQGRAIQAKRLLAEGRVDQAAGESLQIIFVGRRLRDSHGGLVEYVNGMALEGLGLSLMLRLLESPQLGSQRLEQIAALMPDPVAMNKSWSHAMRVGFDAVSRAELDAPSPPRSTWLFDPHATKRRIAEDFLVEIKNASLPFLARDRSVSRKLLEVHREVGELKTDLDRYEETGWLATWKLARTPNAHGKWLEYIAAPVSERGEIMRRQHLFLANVVPTLAALILYRRQHGELPATLDALVEAKVVARLPQDPFDLKPLRFSREKMKLWSVSLDGVDDGGETKATGDPATELDGDMTVVIPELPKPKIPDVKKPEPEAPK